MLPVFARPKVAAGSEVSDGGHEEHVPQKLLGGQGALLLISRIPWNEQVQCQIWLLEALQSPILLHTHPCCETCFLLFSRVTLCSSSVPLIPSLGK